MNIRTICVVLSADRLVAEQERCAEKMKTVNVKADAVPHGLPLLEAGLMRCGHVFELHGFPKLNRGDLTVFTGVWGQDERERRVRLHVTVAYFDSVADTWFNVIVVVTPPKEQAQADWNEDGVAAVMKASRKATRLDLLECHSSVVNAAVIGWDIHNTTPMMPGGVMVMYGEPMTNPEDVDIHDLEGGEPAPDPEDVDIHDLEGGEDDED